MTQKPAAPSTVVDRVATGSVAPASTDATVAARGMFLLVMAPGVFKTHALPHEGQVTIGRGTEAGVSIEDPRASRLHARLHLGAELQIEDLASANGTRLREQKLLANQPAPLLPGEAFSIGDSVLMVRARAASESARHRLLSHADFTGRLEWECARAQSGGPAFSIVRLRVPQETAPARMLDALEHILRPVDVAGLYAPGEFEILLVATDERTAERVMGALEMSMVDAGLAPRIGRARFPGDGRHADALLARANARLPSLVPPPPLGDMPGATSGISDAGNDAPVIDAAMSAPWSLAERAAAGSINVLILGETGAGKERIARAIHDLSARVGKPFVVVNCAALAEPLAESELFGHERGAFTGAGSARTGLVETANGGTVFLDEIGEMPFAMQAKLLRVLETHEVTPVGSSRSKKLDVRFVAATNRDLDAEAMRGEFRRDLYFRLAGMAITVPPLRGRPIAIAQLAQKFIQQQCQLEGRAPAPALSGAALDVLRAYDWPGNVRELKNVMERAMLLLAPGSAAIGIEHLPENLRPRPQTGIALETRPVEIGHGGGRYPEAERQRVLAALSASGGNQTRAAAGLHMSRKALIARLEAFGIARPRPGSGKKTTDTSS